LRLFPLSAKVMPVIGSQGHHQQGQHNNGKSIQATKRLFDNDYNYNDYDDESAETNVIKMDVDGHTGNTRYGGRRRRKSYGNGNRQQVLKKYA
jgi:hypothetical protein